MKLFSNRCLLALLMLTVGATCAIAQPPEGRRGGRRGGPGGAGFMRMLPIMAALDKDEDGTISAEEIENAVAALKTLDKNGDGKLTSDELRPNFRGRGDGFGFGGRGGAAPDPEAMVKRWMDHDKNDDKKLSKDETPEQFARMFDRIDEDGDELLSESEVKKMVDQMLERRGGRRLGRGDNSDRPRRQRRPE